MMCRHWAFGAVLGLWLLSVQAGFAADSPIFLDASQILDHSVNGLSIPESGNYSVWVWCKDMLPLTAMIGSQTLPSDPAPKPVAGSYSWRHLGDVHIDQPQTLTLRLLTNPITQTLDERAVGWLVLTQDSDWQGEAWFAETRVNPHSVSLDPDARLSALRKIENYYPFPQYTDKQEWLERKRYLKDHILTSMGCFPLPPKTPLNPQITGTIEHDDYIIQNVYFESMPGFFATGNLYLPKGKPGPYPAVLCPHGHWEQGRLTNTDVNSIPGRCINFAKQGYIAFAIDMIGYVDSQQLTHKFGAEPEWLWGLSLHGLQFWNSVRAIDYLLSLENVDPDRITCTGASGGGTQTYCLMAVDERLQAAAPVNMLSSHYQGGCLCENAPNLRINANNVEYGAMMAPRPLMMVSCTGDWTNETLRVEFPAIRSIYQLFGHPEKVGTIQQEANHNYNQFSRETVYAWFGKWILGNDDAASFKEQPFTVDPPEKMRVFPNSLPENALKQDQIIAQWQKMSEDQLKQIFPDHEPALQAMRRRTAIGLEHVLGVDIPSVNDLSINRVEAQKQGNLYVEKYWLGRKGVGDRLPVIVMVPPHCTSQATLLVDSQGKCAWFDAETGKPGVVLQSLLDRGQIAVLADVFLTGEFNTPFEKAERDTNTSQFLTYNQTDTALRVQDIVTVLSYLRSRRDIERIHLIGNGEAGLWSLLAAAVAPPLNSVVIDAAGFDTHRDQSYLERLFVPGLRRTGDLRSAQAMLAPTPLLIHDTQDRFDTSWAKSAYRTMGAQNLFQSQPSVATPQIIADWLRDRTQ